MSKEQTKRYSVHFVYSFFDIYIDVDSHDPNEADTIALDLLNEELGEYVYNFEYAEVGLAKEDNE